MFTGGTSEKNSYRRAQALANLGFASLAFGLRGQGGSEGELGDFSRQDHLQDILAACDFLAAQPGVDKRRIGVCGSSYGAYLGLLATSKRDIPWICVRVPALYPDAGFAVPTADLIAANPAVFASQRGLNAHNNRVLQAIKEYKGKILLVQSGKDEVIPDAVCRAYIDNANTSRLTHYVIKNAGHSISDRSIDKRFIDILSSWLNGKAAPEQEPGLL